MLFLFVLMLVGVDSTDSLVETIRGQRFAAIVGGVCFARAARRSASASPRSAPSSDSARPTPSGNVPGLANLLFSRYVFAFEVTSALLITAALGAMVLAHRERLDAQAHPGEPWPPSGCGTTPTPAARRPAAHARRLRPAQRGRHPGPAARRHRLGGLDLAGPGSARHRALGSGDGARRQGDRAAARPGTPPDRRIADPTTSSGMTRHARRRHDRRSPAHERPTTVPGAVRPARSPSARSACSSAATRSSCSCASS